MPNSNKHTGRLSWWDKEDSREPLSTLQVIIITIIAVGIVSLAIAAIVKNNHNRPRVQPVEDVGNINGFDLF